MSKRSQRYFVIVLSVFCVALGLFFLQGWFRAQDGLEHNEPQREEDVSLATPKTPSQQTGASGNGAPPTAPVTNAVKRISQDELIALYKAYTPVVIKERTDVPREQQLLTRKGVIVTKASERVSFKEAAAGTLTVDGSCFVIAQFEGCVTDAMRNAVIQTGASIREYLPHDAYLVEVNQAQLQKVNALSMLRATYALPANYKVEGFLTSLQSTSTENWALPLLVMAASLKDVTVITDAVVSLGGRVQSVYASHASKQEPILRVELPLMSIDSLTAFQAVRAVQVRLEAEPCNDVARSSLFTGAAVVQAIPGLSGEGEIVGHGDSGLDTGDLTTLSADFASCLYAAVGYSWSRGVDQWLDDTGGHGTHTAGSIVGSGALSGGKYKGIAPAAKLYHQSFGIESGRSLRTADDISFHFEQAVAAGARIHSDSWGVLAYEYSFFSRGLDLYSFEHQDFLPVFACGNNGADGGAATPEGTMIDNSDSDGIVDLSEIMDPAYAKNCLAVGALESYRVPQNEEDFLSQTYAGVAAFPAQPIRSDKRSVPYDPTATYGMAAFSSRGPVADGRVKPDIVAPGTQIVSVKSANYGVGNLQNILAEFDGHYRYESGTSMATPIVAGCATIVRQYLRQERGIETPSASLMRAVMLNGAVSVFPGQYGTEEYLEIPAHSPNHVEGFGRCSIDNAIYPADRMLTLIPDLSLVTGESYVATVTVTRAGYPLVATVALTDAPASLYAAAALVNDLDLTVELPSGEVLFSNDLDHSDRRNPVERVVIDSAPVGDYIITLNAFNMPVPGSTASLVYSAATDTTPEIRHQPSEGIVTGTSQVTLQAFIHNNSSLAPTVTYWFSSNPSNRLTIPMAALEDLDFGSTTAWEATIAINPTFEGSLNYAITCSDRTEKTFTVPVGPLVNLTITSTGTEGEPFTLTLPKPGTYQYVKGSRLTCKAYTSLKYGDDPVNSNYAVMTSRELTPMGGIKQTSTSESFTGQSIDLTLNGDTTLVWQYEETNTDDMVELVMGIAVDDYYNGSSRTYKLVSTYARRGDIISTPEMPDLTQVEDSENTFIFVGWCYDAEGTRPIENVYPRPASVSMTLTANSTKLYAVYKKRPALSSSLPETWKTRYFGLNATASASDDPDEDGYSNLDEYLDGSNPLDASSVPVVPTVELVPLPAVLQDFPPWRIKATANDNVTIEDLYIQWRVTGSSSWSKASSLSSFDLIDQTYYTSFNPGLNVSSFEYRIVVADSIGKTNANGLDSKGVSHICYSQTYTSQVSFSAPNFTWRTFLVPTSPYEAYTNDTYNLTSDQYPASFTWQIANGAGQYGDLQWSVELAAPVVRTLSDGTMGGQWRKPSATSTADQAKGCLYHMGNLSGPITASDTNPNVEVSYLTFEFDIAETADRLTLEHEYEFPDYWGNTTYGVVEISMDGGSTWLPFTPDGGYPDKRTGSIKTPSFTHASSSKTGTPKIVHFSLADYRGHHILVRLAGYAGRSWEGLGSGYGSNSCNTGWYIYGFSISEAQAFPGLTCEVDWSPNDSFTGRIPAGDWSNIELTLNPGIDVYSIQNQLLIILRTNDKNTPELRKTVNLTVTKNQYGYPYYWLRQIFPGLTDSQLYLKRMLNNIDTDSDGLSDLDEYTIGTNPNDANSTFGISQLVRDDEGVCTLALSSGKRATIEVEYRSDLSQEWEIIKTIYAPTDTQTTLLHKPREAKGFYRMRAVVAE